MRQLLVCLIWYTKYSNDRRPRYALLGSNGQVTRNLMVPRNLSLGQFWSYPGGSLWTIETKFFRRGIREQPKIGLGIQQSIKSMSSTITHDYVARISAMIESIQTMSKHRTDPSPRTPPNYSSPSSFWHLDLSFFLPEEREWTKLSFIDFARPLSLGIPAHLHMGCWF